MSIQMQTSSNFCLTFLVTSELPTAEFGHSVQNCIYGPFMIFLVSLPSVIRYHYRNFTHKGAEGYADIWFEKQANIFGEKFK